MKKFFLCIKSYFQAIRIIGKRIYNNIFLGRRLSYKAKRLRDYVYKVAMEDYQPVSLAELEDEENVTKAEIIAEKLDNAKRQESSDKNLSNDDVALLEEFMEFLHRKG